MADPAMPAELTALLTTGPAATEATSTVPAPEDHQEGAGAAEALGEGGIKALEAERKARRDADAQVKALQAQIDEAARQGMSDIDRQIDEARTSARADALAEVATERTVSAIKVEAAKNGLDIDALLEAIDASRFVKDGQPDAEAITEWLGRVTPTVSAQRQPVDLGQGVRNATPLNGDPLENSLKQALGI
mgnify:FL=1